MSIYRPDNREQSIVWEEDIDDLDYVREFVVEANTRQRPVPWGDNREGRRVGYAVLFADSRNDGRPGTFNRRVFFLKDYDRDSDPEGPYSDYGAPSEAVDPRTVAPGVPGTITDRAWGRPVHVGQS